MKFILRLKSWQLFLLILIPYCFPTNFLIGQVINLIWISVYIGWIYAIGTTMHQLLPERLKPNIGYFKVSCLFVVTLYAFLIFHGGFTIDQSNYKEYGSSVWVLIPLMLYTMWSLLYIFSFAARILESNIKGELVNWSDSIKTFFCFWFFPLGIWYIQPTVQRALDTYSGSEEHI